MTGKLRDAMGEDGSTALLSRALTHTEAHHQALKTVRRLDGTAIELDGVVAAVEKHGAAEVSVAIEALFAALIDILSRLIGEDMAIRIIDHDGPASRNGGATSQ